MNAETGKTGNTEATAEAGYVALLRGVNVGGRRMPMAELREVLAGLGHRQVRTYLQSGNAVFAAPASAAPDAIARELEEAIAERFGFRVPTLVLTAEEVRAAAARCPFDTASLDPSRVLVVFLDRPAGGGPLAGVDPGSFAPDVYALGEREIFAHFPNGMGRSRLGELLLGTPRPGAVATARNWRTVGKLLELAGS